MTWSDAARAAALEMRRRRAAGQPWKRQRLTAMVAMSDPTRVGGTLAHNKILKNLNLRAVTNAQAQEKAIKFYKKRGYSNLKVLGISPRKK